MWQNKTNYYHLLSFILARKFDEFIFVMFSNNKTTHFLSFICTRVSQIKYNKTEDVYIMFSSNEITFVLTFDGNRWHFIFLLSYIWKLIAATFCCQALLELRAQNVAENYRNIKNIDPGGTGTLKNVNPIGWGCRLPTVLDQSLRFLTFKVWVP